METIARHPTRDRASFARPLLVAVVIMEAFHLGALLVLPHPVLISNLLQLLLPLVAAGVSLHQRRCATNLLGHRCWTALTSAFAIWSAAQAIYIYFLDAAGPVHWSVRPDDALWLLFGLPLLLAITWSADEVDRVTWLDRAQAFLFFLVLYLLVFRSSGRLQMTQAYFIQNLALLLCCVLRLPVSTLARERRFFTRLALFLFVYGSMETAVEVLYTRGWQIGSLVDLGWTLPFAFFIVLTLRDALRSRDQPSESNGLVRAAIRMQGVSVTAMAFLSIGLAGVLATRQPALGGALVIAAFALFALRTNAREAAWHQAHRNLEKSVLEDTLTGLGNRVLLRNELTERLAFPSSNTVLFFVDLDRFKGVNDSFGHALGDRLLIEVGQRLRAAAPQEATVCRLGGDEFIVLSTAQDEGAAQTAGTHLAEALHSAFLIAGHELRCTASIGVVFALPGESADTLLRTADHAMYRAKQSGRNRVQLFDTVLRAEMNGRWRMEYELRTCVENNTMGVAFQPIYAVKEGKICGFEALARWTHPQLGSVPPLDFIVLAEETGLILSLGAQILEKACRQMAAWNRMWQTSLSVSVNVSPRQFADPALLPTILEILDTTGFPPSLLRLEITESALLVHESKVRETLAQARAHGIRISLDDFGTGYSSLSFLLSLPVDEVKVDRSFVSRMQEDSGCEELVRAVVHLSHTLGKRVIAEGVETEADLRDLAAMGCECVQGWLISRPLAPEDLEARWPKIDMRATPVLHEVQRISPPNGTDTRQQQPGPQLAWFGLVPGDPATAETAF